MKQAQYQCLRCEHEWSEKPGPTECPLCGHVYVKWVNYETDFAKKQ